MFSDFAGETLFYRYDAKRSKVGDLLSGRIIIESERIDQPYRRIAEVCFMTILLASSAIRLQDVSS
jgi:hypothetical protein